jgi:translation elongation factor EF-4
MPATNPVTNPMMWTLTYHICDGYTIIEFPTVDKRGDLVPYIFKENNKNPKFNHNPSEYFDTLPSTRIQIPVNEVFLMFAQSLCSIERCMSSPMFIAFEFAKDYIFKALLDYVSNMSRRDSIRYITHVVNAGLNYRKIVNYLDTLIEEEAEHMFLTAKAKIIQRRYREAIANPYTHICKNRLLHEWTELVC